jgi:hypothetical protein
MKKLIYIIFFFILAAPTIANRFDDLEKQKVFERQDIMFHILAYDDSAKIYHKDLVDYIKNKSFQGELEDSTNRNMMDFEMYKVNMEKTALYLANYLCLNDSVCKEILWSKLNPDMGTELFSSLTLLLPERIPTLLEYCKAHFSTHIWAFYSRHALTLLSYLPQIDTALADTLASYCRKHQPLWGQTTKRFTATSLESLIKKLNDRILAQQKGFSVAPFKYPQSQIEVQLETLIHDENWKRICPEYNLIKEQEKKRIAYERWDMLIQRKCGTLSKDGQEKLKESLMNPYYLSILPATNYPTPTLNKLLHDYLQELLAERKKRNPVKWRIWPELVGERK